VDRYQARRLLIVRRARRKKPIAPPAVRPITWHQGWEEVGTTAGGDPARPGEQAADAPTGPAGFDGEATPENGLQQRVELSIEPFELRGDAGNGPQYLTASLERPEGDESAPRVLIGHNKGGAVAATLDEARRFALEILALVDGNQS
jgi:hypothetical protein